MSQVLTIKLSKFDNQPWGFRLQGGKDFGTPLSVQKVNGGSLSEQAGLHAGDNILKINGQEVFNLRHKEAQDVLVKAGNNYELTVSRGGVWKPQVTPLAAPLQQSNGEPALITKTSLTTTTQHVGMPHPPSFNQNPKPFGACAFAGEPVSSNNNNNYSASERMAKGSLTTVLEPPQNTAPVTEKEVRTVSAHNSVSKPFAAAPAAKVNGAPEVKAVNKQFNSPIGLYSEESIAETLSAQAEVLAQGVLGVNFKKNEKHFDATNSEVFKMVQDLDKQPREPEPGIDIDPVEASPQQKGLSARNIQSYSFKRLQETLNVIDAPVGTQEIRPPSTASGLRHVEPPKPKPESAANAPLNAAAQGPHVRCSECDRLVVGVFVRIKDKNLHVECFKCTICGTSLKNVGYYNINAKLYCDIHARQVARHGPPAPNMEPITIQPDAPIPTGALAAEVVQKLPAQVAAAPAAPAPAPVAPLPKPLLAGPTPFSPIKAPAAHPVVFGGVNPPPAGGVSVFPPATSRTSQPGAGLGLKGVNKFDECASTEVTSVLTESSSSVTRQVEVQESVQSYSSSSVTTSEHLQEVAAPVPAPSAVPSHTFSPLAKLGGNVANRPGELSLPGLSRFVWPPRNDENVTSPTATPLWLYPVEDQLTSSVSADTVPDRTQEPAVPFPSSSPPSSLAPQDAQSHSQAPEFLSAAPAVELVQSVQPQIEPEVDSMRTQLSPPPPAPVVELETNPVPVSIPGPAVDTLALGDPAYPTPDLAGLLPGGLPGLSLNAGGAPVGPASSGATIGTHSAPRRGRGILNKQVGPGVRVPVCASVSCGAQIRAHVDNVKPPSHISTLSIASPQCKCNTCNKVLDRGPFVTALGRTWCPEHFVCHNTQCRRHLQDVGFVEEKNELYCESCFENFLAPVCGRCQKRVKGDCLNAIGKQFHPECFACAYCGRLFGNNHFYLEDGLPYCESDWNELFTTKCFACKFPIEAGDRWVEAMNNNYHSQCFNCSICKKNLEGQSFLAKGGRPMCKSHAH